MTRSNERETKYRSTSSSLCDLAERFLELRRLRKQIADLEQPAEQSINVLRNMPDRKQRK